MDNEKAAMMDNEKAAMDNEKAAMNNEKAVAMMDNEMAAAMDNEKAAMMMDDDKAAAMDNDKAAVPDKHATRTLCIVPRDAVGNLAVMARRSGEERGGIMARMSEEE